MARERKASELNSGMQSCSRHKKRKGETEGAFASVCTRSMRRYVVTQRAESGSKEKCGVIPDVSSPEGRKARLSRRAVHGHEEESKSQADFPPSGATLEVHTSNEAASKAFKKRKRRKLIVRARKRKRASLNCLKQEKDSKENGHLRDCQIKMKTEEKAKRPEEEVEAKFHGSSRIVEMQEGPKAFGGSERDSALEGNADIKHSFDKTPFQDAKLNKGLGSNEAWTREQEIAMQNAYFLVKPGPNFWREIAKRVPGKAAKECFDRFYSAYPTPLPPTRARRYHVGSPIKSISGDSFLSPTMSAVKPSSRFGNGKQALLEAHRTVRRILRKQQTADEGYEADVFAAVESADSVPLPVSVGTTGFGSTLNVMKGKAAHTMEILTPEKRPFGSGCERSSNILRQTFTHKSKQSVLASRTQPRTDSFLQGQLQSPEVLKTESNPERLDRYLDRLHLRRVDRQSRSSQNGKLHTSLGEDMKKDTIQCVQAAKVAVIATAREMIQTVLNRQFSVMETESMMVDEREDDLSLDLG